MGKRPPKRRLPGHQLRRLRVSARTSRRRRPVERRRHVEERSVDRSRRLRAVRRRGARLLPGNGRGAGRPEIRCPRRDRSPIRGRSLPSRSPPMTIVIAVVLATRRFPGGFDWVYTVMSALASRKHNPDGSVFLCSGARPLARTPVARDSMGFANSMGRLTGSRGSAYAPCNWASSWAWWSVWSACSSLTSPRSCAKATRSWHSFPSSASTPVSPPCKFTGCVCAKSLPGPRSSRSDRSSPSDSASWGLYLDQRDLGWVDTSWREMGVPVWLSFAFWQWLATAALWASVGHLVVSGRSSRVKVPAQSRASENEPPGAAVRQGWTPGSRRTLSLLTPAPGRSSSTTSTSGARPSNAGTPSLSGRSANLRELPTEIRQADLGLLGERGQDVVVLGKIYLWNPSMAITNCKRYS